MKSNVFLEGEGDSSVLYNISSGVNTIEAIGEAVGEIPKKRIN